ncbi:AAA family ATPase [Pseudomonas pudica]|uniref:ATP-binding protein n=1 Tax=Pseudomonas pudica TaxID=272772 RepID=A0ABS0FUI1_9PSED|nr:AAA family ATPase [Pseudomonas pudica]MBF8644038.1 ATP-binding protein [Pseudomonas pudica]MBF8758595.1 ATP-binding protein [Pseudomonas pudica]
MFDEKDFFAGKFWSLLKKRVASRERNDELQVDKALLQMLFIVALDRELVSISPKRFHFKDLIQSKEDHEFDGQWRNIREEIISIMDLPPRIDFFAPIIDRLFFTEAFQAIDSELPRSPDEALRLFDYLFFASAAANLGASSRYLSMVARFSSILAGQISRRVEAFALTGEFLTLTPSSTTTIRPEWPTAYVRSIKGWEFEFELRMEFLHANTKQLVEKSFNSIQLSRGDFVLINAPRKLANSASTGAQQPQIPSTAVTSIQMLDALLSRNHFLEGVVVVPGLDRTASKTELRRVREWLVESKMLVAVIDFPSGSRNVTVSHSAWVLRAHSNASRESVLMVDTRSLLSPNHRGGWIALAEFAARLVLTWENDHRPTDWSSQEITNASDKRLHNIYTREFSEGYRDVPGLCALVSRTEVLENHAQLRAHDYLSSQPPRLWASGLDHTVITEMLAAKRQTREPIYVIGNNGAGKSLLLREIAELSVKQGCATIGVAFGFNDRFPHRPQKNNEDVLFHYEGSRGTGSTASLKKLALDMGKKIYDIHCDAHRLAAFSMGLELLDFRARRYLMPYAADSSVQDNHLMISSTVLLSDLASENINLVQPKALAAMQPALGRMSARSEITPFSELSSGEQQMLALLVKVIASATPNARILIDEPEISLHVSWQRLLPIMLSKMCEHFDCDMVIATHSPLLVTSALTVSNYCFVAQDQQLIPLRVHDRGSVERVLFTGFGTHTENNRQVHERCAAIVSEAIKAVNAEDKNLQIVTRLEEELVVMQRTVDAATGQLRSSSLDSELDLIEKTREALGQLQALVQETGESGQ